MRITSVLFIAKLFLALSNSTLAISQGLVRGSVIDGKGQPLPNASVLLLHPKDSSLVKGTVTTKNGTYIFDKISPASYLVVSSFAGFKDAYSSVFQVGNDKDIVIPAVTIAARVVNLEEVTVTTKKQLFEQKIDRMVINVANSITNTGSTALEVLMRSPGVTVNQQNNSLSMSGKDGVVLMLNGKVTRMPTEALVQMLAGMSSANIEKIELITTPPANFDAEGNAGFINIVLKKNIQYGTNGSLSATIGHGIGGGPVFGGSINFNHRKEKWNLYGDYSFSRTTPNTYGSFYRKVMNGSNLTENFMNTDREDFRRNHNARLGLDYELNGKTVLGILLSGFSNMYGMEAVNKSNIFTNGTLDSTIIINNPERHPLNNYSTNFNVQHHFTTDRQLSLNLDYIFFKDENTLSYLNNFYSSSGTFLNSDKTKSNKETPINFWVGTADYSQNLGKKASIEAGIKSTVSRFVNDVRVEREKLNTWIADKEFTSKHNLKESIVAVYASLNITVSEKTKSKLGLRYEYTNSNLGSETRKNIVDRHYGNLFPSIFVSHAVNDKSSFNFSYSRRITRPTFNDMAPFVYFVDPNTLFSGNPALQPSFADAIKVDYLLNRFIFSLSYTYEKNTITNFAPQVNPGTNKQTLAAENQKDRNIVALTVSLPFTITNWWTMQNNLSGYWQHLRAMYKKAPLNIKQQNFNFNSTQSLTLPKNFSIEISAAYQSGGLFGIYKLAPFTSLNLGIQKKLGPTGGNILFNVTDFSGPPHYKFSVDAPEHNLVTDGDLRFTVTTFKLTYTRKFGNLKLKENRTRTTGSEDERNRVQQN